MRRYSNAYYRIERIKKDKFMKRVARITLSGFILSLVLLGVLATV